MPNETEPTTSVATVEALSSEEKERLEKLEDQVAAGFVHLREAIPALKTIRDERLYREKFASFKEYCESRWKKDSDTIRLMINSEDMRSDLKLQLKDAPEATKLLKDSSQSAVRELSRLPTRKLKTVVRKVKARGGLVTAKAIREAAGKGPLGRPVKPAKQSPASRNGKPKERETLATMFNAKLIAWGKAKAMEGSAWSKQTPETVLVEINRLFVNVLRKAQADGVKHFGV